MTKPLSGRKVLAITVSAFAIIIGVNVLMAVKAISTFPGLEVQNSYVASQVFDAERAAQDRLGWTLAHDYKDGALRLSFRDRDGKPVQVDRLTATVGRTTEARDDRQPEFAFDGADYVAETSLKPGKWLVLMQAFSKDGTRFHQRLDLFVRG